MNLLGKNWSSEGCQWISSRMQSPQSNLSSTDLHPRVSQEARQCVYNWIGQFSKEAMKTPLWYETWNIYTALRLGSLPQSKLQQNIPVSRMISQKIWFLQCSKRLNCNNNSNTEAMLRCYLRECPHELFNHRDWRKLELTLSNQGTDFIWREWQYCERIV